MPYSRERQHSNDERDRRPNHQNASIDAVSASTLVRQESADTSAVGFFEIVDDIVTLGHSVDTVFRVDEDWDA